MTLRTLLLGACSAMAFAGMASAETLTIATVNNGDMIRMQGLTAEFNKAHPDITVNWVTLEENTLRERVTTDTHGHPVLVSEHLYPAHRTEFVVEVPLAEPSTSPAGLRLVE